MHFVLTDSIEHLSFHLLYATIHGVGIMVNGAWIVYNVL